MTFIIPLPFWTDCVLLFVPHRLVDNLCIALDQFDPFPMRHIIVDDHSTDSTRRIVEAFARKHPFR